MEDSITPSLPELQEVRELQSKIGTTTAIDATASVVAHLQVRGGGEGGAHPAHTPRTCHPRQCAGTQTSSRCDRRQITPLTTRPPPNPQSSPVSSAHKLALANLGKSQLTALNELRTRASSGAKNGDAASKAELVEVAAAAQPLLEYSVACLINHPLDPRDATSFRLVGILADMLDMGITCAGLSTALDTPLWDALKDALGYAEMLPSLEAQSSVGVALVHAKRGA